MTYYRGRRRPYYARPYYERSGNTLPALPTIYKDTRFASRTEARWAILFDELGLEWGYEIGKYSTGYGSYTPDFALPDLDVWWEVKGAEPVRGAVLAARGLAMKDRHAVVLSWGAPSTFKRLRITNGSQEYPAYLVRCKNCKKITVRYLVPGPPYDLVFVNQEEGHSWDISHPSLVSAQKKARDFQFSEVDG